MKKFERKKIRIVEKFRKKKNFHLLFSYSSFKFIQSHIQNNQLLNSVDRHRINQFKEMNSSKKQTQAQFNELEVTYTYQPENPNRDVNSCACCGKVGGESIVFS